MAANVKLRLLPLLLTTAILLLVGCQRDKVETLTIAGETFTVELVLTEEEIRTGMSGRDSFPDGGSMLFVFPDVQVRNFWMVDCLIDIDVIFLDSRGFVTATHQMKTEPLQQPDESRAAYEDRLKRYSSVYAAQFAIELPAGSIDRLGVRVDDRIELDYDRLVGLAREARNRQPSP